MIETAYIFVVDTGKFVRSIRYNAPEQLSGNTYEGEDFTRVAPEDDFSYWNGSLWTVIGAGPTPYHNFNWVTKQWDDPRTLSEVREQQWEIIKLARDAAETGTFVWDGSVFDCDAAHINGAVTGAIIAQAAGVPFSVTWILFDNSSRVLNGDEMIQVASTLIQHISSIYDTGRTLRDTLDAATTVQAIEAVVW